MFLMVITLNHILISTTEKNFFTAYLFFFFKRVSSTIIDLALNMQIEELFIELFIVIFIKTSAVFFQYIKTVFAMYGSKFSLVGS